MNENNLQIVIDRFGSEHLPIPRSVSKNGLEIQYKCPFCLKRRGKADNDYKLYVNVDKLKFICFKCHAKGRIRNSHVFESSYGVYNDILGYANVTDDETSDDNMFYVNNIAIPNNSVAYEYCMSRGIDRDTINFYNIRLGTGDLFGRIVIPNYLYTDIWTDMYSSRTYINEEPKYKNPPECKKSNSVFNLHNIKDNADVIYIEEGAITAICAGRDAVCTYGCHPSESQVESILSKNPKSIVCSYDNDEAGQAGQPLLLDMISRKYRGELYFVTMPEGRDAADMGEKAYKEYVSDTRQRYISNAYKKIYDFIKN